MQSLGRQFAEGPLVVGGKSAQLGKSEIDGDLGHIGFSRRCRDDGVDQTGVLLLGETHGRRGFIYIYEGTALKSVVKNKFKMHIAPPGQNPVIAAQFFDLYRDPREERPDQSIKVGTWAGGPFSTMIKRHLGLKKQYPDREVTTGTPYEGIENLRPESQALVDSFLAGKGK